jgi:hypothetical protein
VRQQQPARRIWAMRPGPVLAVAGFTSTANNVATIVAKAIHGQRGSARDMAMDILQKTTAWYSPVS